MNGDPKTTPSARVDAPLPPLRFSLRRLMLVVTGAGLLFGLLSALHVGLLVGLVLPSLALLVLIALQIAFAALIVRLTEQYPGAAEAIGLSVLALVAAGMLAIYVAGSLTG